VFQSHELSRTDRQRLLRHSFVREIMKGWLIAANPDDRDGDSTAWYASFWEFCDRYCNRRFGVEWHLSPEQSLLLHTENTVVPTQLIVYSPRGTNNDQTLLFGTSLYDLKEPQPPPATDLTIRNGLRLFSPAAAIVKVPQSFFARSPVDAQVFLMNIADASDVLRYLLDGGHSVVAGRLAGAFRRIGRPEVADDVLAAMRAAGYEVRETDPFVSEPPLRARPEVVAPVVGRLRVLWESMRDKVITTFPKPPDQPLSKETYIRAVDAIYQSDAYHSLSIEGYRVTPELIERERTGSWDPDNREPDRRSRDALAARGYWQAFQSVKADIADILTGANPGALIRRAHRDWYRELFEPCVAAGLIPRSALAGYRNDFVYLRNSRYVPPRWEAVREAMPTLFDLLEKEPEPSVRAVLGHWLFGYIHPYPDGNGRIARFLMNAMLASGAYPWTVVRVEDRDAYMAALERANIDFDIGPLATFTAERVQWSLEHIGAKA
jgi:fido (protein-threonine AMPylation protein)